MLDDLAVPIGTALHALRLSLQLRASRERLVTSVEDERRRTGRDLHDSLGPRLAAIGMTVETAAELVETDPQAARRLLSVLLQQTDAAVSEVRQLAHTQRPPVLDALGLVGALQTHLALLSPLRARLEVRGEWPEALPCRRRDRGVPHRPGGGDERDPACPRRQSARSPWPPARTCRSR